MKDLNVLVDKLCEDLTNELCMAYKHCEENGAHYAPKVGKKYIKIVSYDNAHKGGVLYGVSLISTNSKKDFAESLS